MCSRQLALAIAYTPKSIVIYVYSAAPCNIRNKSIVIHTLIRSYELKQTSAHTTQGKSDTTTTAATEKRKTVFAERHSAFTIIIIILSVSYVVYRFDMCVHFVWQVAMVSLCVHKQLFAWLHRIPAVLGSLMLMCPN